MPASCGECTAAGGSVAATVLLHSGEAGTSVLQIVCCYWRSCCSEADVRVLWIICFGNAAASVLQCVYGSECAAASGGAAVASVRRRAELQLCSCYKCAEANGDAAIGQVNGDE